MHETNSDNDEEFLFVEDFDNSDKCDFEVESGDFEGDEFDSDEFDRDKHDSNELDNDEFDSEGNTALCGKRTKPSI